MSVFLGWMPDAAAQAALSDLQQRLCGALPADAPRHAWRKPAQWHLTLRYLGDALDDAQRMRIESAMAVLASQVPTVDAALERAEYWQDARVLVAGIGASPGMQALLDHVDRAVHACGCAPERAQLPHVTLAYLPRGAPPPALPEMTRDPATLRVDRVQLLQTMPGGYMSLAAWPLAPGATPA